jgi:hypothetical protein
MKYLCLVYNDDTKLDAMSRSEFDNLVAAHLAYDEEMRQKGQYVSSAALHPVHTATTVRVRNGKVSTTDGPFAETKEHLGGIILIEAHDLNEAIQVAAKIPSASLGSIEVRPVWSLEHEPRIGRE